MPERIGSSKCTAATNTLAEALEITEIIGQIRPESYRDRLSVQATLFLRFERYVTQKQRGNTTISSRRGPLVIDVALCFSPLDLLNRS